MRISFLRVTALFVTVVLAIFGIGVWFASGSVSTDPDEVALVYNAGPISNTSFDNCVEPGNRDYYGPFDKEFVYPAGQRTYKFNDDGDAERGPIGATSSDNVRLGITGSLRFQLNTDCDTLRAFHEAIGNKYTAYTDDDAEPGDEGINADGVADGWDRLLNDYLGQAVQKAVQSASTSYAWQTLYLDESVRGEFEDAVSAALPGLVSEALPGSDSFFTSFSLTLQQPQPPGDLLAQLQQQQVAAQTLETINAQAASNAARIAQIQSYVDVLGPYGYILFNNQLNCSDGDDTTQCLDTQYLPTEVAVGTGGN